MIRWGAVCAATVLAGAASAADKPAIGPVPAWVKGQVPALIGRDDGAAARILLADQQTKFGQGESTTFSENVIALQTAQGLPAGNIAFAWDPATQTPIVHQFRIRRGDKSIDVLATQNFTVLRREQNLESATLDGVLTATLQPEGLQVGDVVDFAISITTRNPVLGEHVEWIGGGWNGLPVGKAHLRAEWPASLPLRFRQPGGLPTIRQEKVGDLRTAELTLQDLQPLPPPNGAPMRFTRTRLVEMSDYRAWADLGAQMAPLYAKAGTLPITGPLHDEWVRLDAGAATRKAKAAAMLAFVQDRVRYVALQMGAGGYTPADAAVTWERRFGDCKGKTALLLALLHASGIEAVPVAANAGGGDGLDQSLPIVELFNHVLVRATIDGHEYWLDGTRSGDISLDRLRTPNFGWGLPLVARNASLVRMLPAPLERPDLETAAVLDASAGLTMPGPFHVETVLRGDAALATSLSLRNLTPELLNKGLRDYWRKQYNYVEPEKVEARFDPVTGEEHLTMSGTATMQWNNGWFETDGTGLGWQADFHRDPGPDRDAPFSNNYPFYTSTKEAITLPSTFHGNIDRSSTEVDQTIAGVRYRRTVMLKDGLFEVEATQRSLGPEFPAADAPAAQAALRKMADNSVQLRRPDSYKLTPKELDALPARTAPKTAGEFDARGLILFESGRHEAARADFDRALAIDPKNVSALAHRGMLALGERAFTAAHRDIAAVETLSPRDPMVLRLLAAEAIEQGKFSIALDFLNRELAIQPDDLWGKNARAQAAYNLKQYPQALADVEWVIARKPDYIDAQMLRLNIMRSSGQKDQMPQAISAMLASNKESTVAHVFAGNILNSLGERDAGMREYAAALAIKPESFIYINRGLSRPLSDSAGRRSDFEEALRLEPVQRDATLALFWMDEDQGDYPSALKRLAPLLVTKPHDFTLLRLRGRTQFLAGQQELAAADYAAARAAAETSSDYNALCWDKATLNFALASALDDCNAAIAKDPLPTFVDSRALVQLRLGRLDQALADYNLALAKRPRQASSLYGRSLVYRRRGEATLADADAKAALAIDPDVAKEFDLAKPGTKLPTVVVRSDVASARP